MQIQVETDRNIEGNDALTAQVVDVLEGALSRISDRVTRVLVHLSDENSDKKGGDEDIRCLMEATLEGSPPTAVSHQAATWEQAVNGGAGQLARLLTSRIERGTHLESQRDDPPLADAIFKDPA